MNYDLEISHRARLEIDDALEWFGTYSEASAVRWRDQLLAHAAALRENPRRYPLAAEAEELGIDLPEMTFGKRKQKYRVLFTVTE